MKKTLHGVGYWLDFDDPKSKLPQPSWLPNHNWEKENLGILLCLVSATLIAGLNVE